MKRYAIIVSFILTCLMMMNCEEGGNSVIGSRNHDIHSAVSTEPKILANGISTTQIIANVRNKDGTIASNMKVHFETTAGQVEEYGISDTRGDAEVTLTSTASDSDLTAKITATVVDTTFSPLNKQNENSYSVTLSTPDIKTLTQNENALNKTNQSEDNRATLEVKFLGVTFEAEVDETILPADGISEILILVKLRETTSFKVIGGAEIHAYTRYGSIKGSRTTNENGTLEFSLVADNQANEDTLWIEYGKKLTKKFPVSYINPKLKLIPKALQVPADGSNKIEIVGNLLSHRNTPIQGAVIKFSTSAGVIPERGTTNKDGNATVELISTTQPDSAVMVISRFHSLLDTAIVAFVSSSQVIPNSILLNTAPNYIWVKETGNIDQTIISASVLGVNNQPLGNDIGVKFYIVNSPGGGEYLVPSENSPMETTVIPTVGGIAKATIRSGTKSGTVQIKAELVDFPEILSQTTNIVIRSGPPYMWVDPTNANNVIDYATLAIAPDKHNVAFTNPIQEIQVSAYFGDRYNNPIEEGTAVYFTTTGGYITSDALTNDKGQTSVILQNVNPFPYLVSNDPNQMTSLTVPNPNDSSLMINIDHPDFEDGEVVNTIGTTNENDGMAVILAYTWGHDQDGNLIKVWTTHQVIYSTSISPPGRFDAWTDADDTLVVGQVANIYIRVYDDNGNPVAAGSRLTVTASAGELSESNLIPAANRWGHGWTSFHTQLLNNLKPGEDEPTDAIVKIQLDSPNGSGTRSLKFRLEI